MPEHKIHCPSCAQHLSVPEELAGQRIDCPSCNKSMTLPDFAQAFDEPEEEEPAEESPSRKSPALIAGIAGVVLIAGAIGFLALNEKDQSEEEQQTSAIDKTDPPEINPETTAKTYATWEEYKAASQAEGWHYDVAEYVGDVPDEENFFMAKPFSGLLYTQQIGGKPVYLNPTIKTNFEAVMNLRVSPQHRIQGRQFPDWRDFAKQLRLEPSRARYANGAGSVKGTDQEVVDRYFAKFDGLISDLREAAKRPKQNFPYPFENGQNVLLPHLAKFKGITQLLQHSAAIKLARGDADRAMEDVRLQFRLFEATGGDIYLIGQLVHAAIAHIIVDGLTAGLHMGQWSDEQLVEWDKLLTLERDYLKQWDRCMQGERLSTGLTIESAINGVDLGDGWDFAKDTKMIPKQWLVKDLIFFDTTLKKYIELIRQAKDTGRIDQNKISLHFSEAAKTSKQKLYPFSRMFLPALNKALNKTGRMMNSFSAARLGIAIERYRRAKGDLPGDLSDLVPDYIGALPKDALTGKPLAWEHHGSPRYKIPVSDTDSQSWKYDGILAAIQAGDLGRLKAFAEKGWKITRSEGGSTQPPESNPNMAGMMPYGMMGPGMLGGSKTIDFSASETEILTQQNALHHAMHSGNPELVQWLIERGLDPNTTASIWTPQPADEEVVGRMDDMFSMGMMGMGGDGGSERTVLEFAVSEQQTEMVKVLLDAGVLPIEADEEPKRPGNPTPPGMGMPGMMGGMPGMIVPPTGNPYGMMGMGMPGMGMPLPETPTAFELANTEILPLLLAKVPKELLPKALGEDSVVSLLRKTLAKRDLAKARLLIEKGANVNHPPPSLEPEAPEPGEFGSPGMPLGQGMPGMPPGMMPMPKSIWIDGYLYHEGLGGGMGMMEDTNKVDLTTLSVVSQAARIGDWDFFNLVLEKGGDSNRREIDASTPLHHAAANPDGAILKQLLAKQPDLTAKDNSGKSPAVHAAKAGLLDNVKQLQQAGSDLNNKAVVNVSIQSLNIKLLAHLINNAKKPLNENSTWAEALGILATEIPDDADEEQTANIRKIGTLLFDNGLRSNSIQNIEDLERAITEAQ